MALLTSLPIAYCASSDSIAACKVEEGTTDRSSSAAMQKSLCPSRRSPDPFLSFNNQPAAPPQGEGDDRASAPVKLHVAECSVCLPAMIRGPPSVRWRAAHRRPGRQPFRWRTARRSNRGLRRAPLQLPADSGGSGGDHGPRRSKKVGVSSSPPRGEG